MVYRAPHKLVDDADRRHQPDQPGRVISGPITDHTKSMILSLAQDDRIEEVEPVQAHAGIVLLVP
jgi:hypothetical protein